MSAPIRSVLLADDNASSREQLINHLLMSGADQVAVAVSADEFVTSLTGDGFDLVVIAQAIFNEQRAKSALWRFRKSKLGQTNVIVRPFSNRKFQKDSARGIIVLLDDERGDTIKQALTMPDVYICLPRSTADRVLRSLCKP